MLFLLQCFVMFDFRPCRLLCLPASERITLLSILALFLMFDFLWLEWYSCFSSLYINAWFARYGNLHMLHFMDISAFTLALAEDVRPWCDGCNIKCCPLQQALEKAKEYWRQRKGKTHLIFNKVWPCTSSSTMMGHPGEAWRNFIAPQHGEKEVEEESAEEDPGYTGATRSPLVSPGLW